MPAAQSLVSDVIKNKVWLCWVPPSDYTSQVRIRESGENAWTNASSAFSGMSYQINNLTPGTTYEWSVVCKYKTNSYYSETKTFTIPPALSTPSNLSAVSMGTSATLSWDAVTNADFYQVSIKKSTATTYTTNYITGKTSMSCMSLDDTATYNWKVRALDKEQEYCDSVSSANSFAYVITEPLSSPTGLTHDQVTSSSARVGWNAVTNATDYKVEYRVQGATDWTEDNND